MDFHYELLEETREEIKNMQFFREGVEINAEEYEVIYDYDEAYENAFSGGMSMASSKNTHGLIFWKIMRENCWG